MNVIKPKIIKKNKMPSFTESFFNTNHQISIDIIRIHYRFEEFSAEIMIKIRKMTLIRLKIIVWPIYVSNQKSTFKVHY